MLGPSYGGSQHAFFSGVIWVGVFPDVEGSIPGVPRQAFGKVLVDWFLGDGLV